MSKHKQFHDNPEAGGHHHYADSAGEASTQCSAFGCKLPGTISTSPTGGNWRCWAHDATEDFTQWQALTQAINEHPALFTLAGRIACMSPYEVEKKWPAVNEWLAARGMGELCRKANTGEWSDRITHEPRSAWAQRIRNYALKLGAAKGQA